MNRLKYIVFLFVVLPSFAVIGPSLALGQDSSAALPQQVPASHLVYEPEYTAEQVLNGSFPGRPAAPPPLPVSFSAEGFAADRLFHVPAVGQHPRILFSSDDLPGIRMRLNTTRSGRQMLAFVRQQLAKGIDKPGTWENRLYTDLVRGDLEDFGRLYKPGNSALPGNSNVTMPGNGMDGGDLKPATKWHHRDPFGVAMEMKAFVCLLDGNQAEGARLGQAIAAWATYYRPRVEAAAAGRYGNNWWRTMRSAVEQWPFLPFAYDWDYNYMTAAQRDTTRQVLALVTGGRYSLGMDLPAHWRNWNFLGMSMYEVLYALAIEGEPGYDPRIYRRGVEVTRDFLSFAINPSGMAHESIGYHGGAMEHFSELMIAMANRGDNMFTQSHYRAQLDEWYVQALEPWGQEWVSDGDLGNFAPSDESLMVAKYFFPSDQRLDYVFQNLKTARNDNFATDFFMETMLITAQDPARDPSGRLTEYHAGADFGLPLTFADQHRGVMITRSAWSQDALYMNVTCHPDTTFASHDHADRGRFVLSGAGRNWALQDSRPHESSQTNLVLIDGEGEGYFAPPARWLGTSETAKASLASCDMTYPYSWQWHKEAATWSPTDTRLQFPHYAALKEKVDELAGQKWEYDPSPGVVAYYANYLKGNPLMWDEDSWVVRRPHNPVRYAYRTAGIVRGAHPYALVVDDLEKDGKAHVYDWIMQLPEDVVLAAQRRQGGVLDITLAEQKGPRRLLLRFFQAGSGEQPQSATVEHFSTAYKLMSLPTQAGTMFRLNVPWRGVDYRGRVLLYAYREGDELPVSQWDAAVGRATVEWAGQRDVLVFTGQADGRAELSVERNGSVIATSR